jgi:hypothetical protein
MFSRNNQFNNEKESDIKIKSSMGYLYLHKDKILVGDYNFLKKSLEYDKNDFIDLSLYSHKSLICFFNMIYYGKTNYSNLSNEEKIQCIDLNNQYKCNNESLIDPELYCNNDKDCIELSPYYGEGYKQIKILIDDYLVSKEHSLELIEVISDNINNCVIRFDQKKLIKEELYTKLEKQNVLLSVGLKLKYIKSKSVIENKKFLDYLLYLNKCKVFRNEHDAWEYDGTGEWYEYEIIKHSKCFNFYSDIKLGNVEELKFGLDYLEIPQVLDEYRNFFRYNAVKEEEIDILLKIINKYKYLIVRIYTSIIKSDEFIDRINDLNVKWEIIIDDDNLNFKKIKNIEYLYFSNKYDDFNNSLINLTNNELEFYSNYISHSNEMKEKLILHFQKNKIQKTQLEFLFNNGNLIEGKTLSILTSTCEDIDKLNIFSEKYIIKWKIIIDEKKPNFDKLKNVDIIIADIKYFTIDDISPSNKLIIINNNSISIKSLSLIDKKINELYIEDSTIRDIDDLNLLKNIKVLYFGKECKFLVKKSNKKIMKSINIFSSYLKEFKYHKYLNLKFVINNKIKQFVTDDLIKEIL